MQQYIGNNLSIYSHWEKNENFFNKIKDQLNAFGDVNYCNSFYNMENYIRWKGKDDPAKYSGKSMLRISLKNHRNISLDVVNDN